MSTGTGRRQRCRGRSVTHGTLGDGVAEVAGSGAHACLCSLEGRAFGGDDA